MPVSGTRFAGLDTLRGITLVSMIVYHLCWDMVYLFGADWDWYRSAGAYIWQQSICWTFILLSGYCWNLGRRHGKRGLSAFCGGMLVTAVTFAVTPESLVFCGVLTLLGVAVLLTIPLAPLLRRIPARAGLAVSFSLFLLTRDVTDGRLGFEGAQLLALPENWYRSWFTALLGFPQPGFFSTDYFPIIPWIFLFWTGWYLYPLRRQEPSHLALPVVTAMGRHSLLVYLLHQPVIYVVLWLLTQLRS